MGRNPTNKDNWSPELIEGEFLIITDTFPCNKFLPILWNLYLNDNDLTEPRGSKGCDKLHKIRPFVDTLTQTFFPLYNLHIENSIDEALIGYKGRSSLKQKWLYYCFSHLCNTKRK